MKKALPSAILYIGSMLAALSLYAGGGLTLRVQGIEQQAMGGVGTGLQVNAASLYYNPGAVPFVRKQQLSLGANLVHSITAYAEVPPGVTTAQTTSRPTTPLYGYVLLRPNRDAAINLGLAVYSPFGCKARWDDAWKGRIISQEFELSTIAVQPTVSLRLGTRLGVGLGLVVASGAMLWRKARQEGTASSGYSESYTGVGSSLRLNAGIYYKPSRMLSIGLNMQSASALRITQGEARYVVPASLSSQFPNTSFSAKIPLPQTITLGIGFYPDDRLTLALDISRQYWHSLDSLTLFVAAQTPYVGDRTEIFRWKNSLAVRMGAEYTANERLAVRAGLAWEQSPVTANYLSPMLPDATSIHLTTGLGVRISDNIQADGCIMAGFTGQHTAVNVVKNFGGIYKTNHYTLGVGITYSW